MEAGTVVDRTRCRICGSESSAVGSIIGKFSQREYDLRHCDTCHFSYVLNPSTDYASVYDEAYYRGRGADPLLDYVFELDCPGQTVRHYEWRGIVDVVRTLVPAMNEETRWLDFGCGNGGLVRYCVEQIHCKAVGLDEGWIRDRAVQRGIPYVSAEACQALRGTFDVITAIEVLEHVPEPIATLKTIRSLLKDGGVFYLTTGNAKPFRNRLLQWDYVIPDIHVSFFEPETLERALTATGFTPRRCGFVDGYTDIIRFKVLKTLRVRRRSLFEAMLPWPIISRLADWRFGVSAHPVGFAGESR